MKRIVAITDLLVFIIIGVISCSLARPSNEEKQSRIVREDDSILELEFRDLFSEASSPAERIANGKKHMKNSSGKSDEGGFYKTYGSDADGEKGYVKQTYSNGDHGYKTFDTFHKKDGDNYGFEEHTAFGKAQGGKKAGKQGKNGAYTSNDNDGDHEGAGTIVDTHYVEEDGDNAALKEAEEGGSDASGESSSYTDDGENENYTVDEGGDAAPYTEGGDATHYTEGGDAAHYTEGGDAGHYTEGGDAGHYTEGGDAGHYTEGGNGGHYTEGGSGTGNYGNSDGYNEHYSSGGGDEGSYGTHGSYTLSGDGDGPYGGEYY